MKTSKHIFRSVLALFVLFAGESLTWGGNYFAKLTIEQNPTGVGTVYGGNDNAGTAYTQPLSKSTTTSGGDVVFYIKAESASEEYYFSEWTGSGNFGAQNSSSTTVTVKAASNTGENNATPYTVVANYSMYHFASLVASGNSYCSITVSPEQYQKDEAANADKTYSVSATGIANGYHFSGWTVSNGSPASSDANPATIIVKTASTGGKADATKATISASIVENYHTRVDVVNNASDKGTAYVKYGNSFSGTATTDDDGYGQASAGYEETYSLKAAANPGFGFVGWSVENGLLASNFNESTTVKVVTNGSYQGAANPYVCTVTANFRKVYSITVKASGSDSGRIVFRVTGPKNYRISVPVGGQIILRDVPEGSYTITPEKIWNWSHVVSAAQMTEFDSENMSVNDFTVSPKETGKKHDEKSIQKTI